MANHPPVRVVAVTGGKGGVGKTTVAANLAIAFARRGKEVMFLDADLGLSNVDALLGLRPKANLHHVVKGKCNLEDVLVDGPAGVKVIPVASDTREMITLNQMLQASIIRIFSDLSQDVDVLIVDTTAECSDAVTRFTRATQEVIVVICDEPASIRDACAMINLMYREHGVYRFRILVNRVTNARQGYEIYNKILKVTERFLDVALDYMGYVPEDEYLRRAVQKQRAVVDAFPLCKSAQAFMTLVEKVNTWPMPATASGRLEFFVERLIQPHVNTIGAIS